MTVTPLQPDTEPPAVENMEDSKPFNRIAHLASKRPRRPYLQTTQFNFHRGRDGPSGYRLLPSAEVGYISPIFEGKRAQMAEG